MVNNHRGISYYGGRSSSSSTKVFLRKPSFLIITLYMIILFAFSIFFFHFNTRNALDDDGQKPLFVEHSQSQSGSEGLQVKSWFFFSLWCLLIAFNAVFASGQLRFEQKRLICDLIVCFLGGVCVLWCCK